MATSAEKRREKRVMGVRLQADGSLLIATETCIASEVVLDAAEWSTAHGSKRKPKGKGAILAAIRSAGGNATKEKTA